MSEPVHGLVKNDAIVNTYVMDASTASGFAFLGELVDLTAMTPQPGIGWTRAGKTWAAPMPPSPVPVPDLAPATPREGDTAMATVTDDDPLTIDVAGVSYPARRLQAYTALVGDDVKATWLDGGWVVEDAIEPTTGTS